MVKVKVYNLEGKELEELKLDSKIFDVEVKNSVVHQVVQAQQANARQNLAHTKTRSEVRGGGIKPWRQKGTGRARHGSIRSPLWIGGGIAFGPRKDREFTKKINKKIKRKALYMVLSDKLRENTIVVVDKLELSAIKTKELAAIFKKLPVKQSPVLLALDKKDDNVMKSARNMVKAKTILADSLNVIDLLKYKFLLIDMAGIKKITEVYK